MAARQATLMFWKVHSWTLPLNAFPRVLPGWLAMNSWASAGVAERANAHAMATSPSGLISCLIPVLPPIQPEGWFRSTKVWPRLLPSSQPFETLGSGYNQLLPAQQATLTRGPELLRAERHPPSPPGGIRAGL